MSKLSATALSTYLRSPRAFYWRYIAKLEPIQLSVTTFDHDKLFGQLWAAYVDRFYKGAEELLNTQTMYDDWITNTDGWVPEKARDRLTKAIETLCPLYYQQFHQEDGTRSAGSEIRLEDDTFIAILDGLSEDGTVHEVKTTSRSPQLSEQLWRVQHSLQVKLYCVLAKATGVQIEFGWKDAPQSIFRAPVLQFEPDQLATWRYEFYNLARQIQALGNDPDNYVCHPDGCCLVTKGMVSMCSYQTLCDQGLNDITRIFYKTRTPR